MDYLTVFIQAPILMFPLPSSHSSPLKFFPALTLCHGNRPKSKTPPAAALFTLHAQSHRTSDSTSLVKFFKGKPCASPPKDSHAPFDLYMPP